MLQEVAAEFCEIHISVEIQLHLASCGGPHSVQRRARDPDKRELFQKVFDRIWLVQKPGFAGLDEFWDAGNCRRQHDPLHRHRFHQGDRNALAQTGEHNYVGRSVKLRQTFALHAPES